MPRAAVPSGIEIEYESFGDPSDPTLLLVSGFNAQLISWDDGLVERLAAAGLRPVRFDNRDVGLSSSSAGDYTLSDMAADAVGLLDHLGVQRAHVAGRSMGGMIVQLMAIEHPDRVASLTSIMSRPGDQRIGASTPEVMKALVAPTPPEREAAIEASSRTALWASKRHYDPDVARARAAREFDRAVRPEAGPRQIAAIRATPDWSERLRSVTAPTLVLHGLDDTLITPEGGVATAELIPGARLEILADMGHDMLEPQWPLFVGLLAEHCRAAASART